MVMTLLYGDQQQYVQLQLAIAPTTSHNRCSYKVQRLIQIHTNPSYPRISVDSSSDLKELTGWIYHETCILLTISVEVRVKNVLRTRRFTRRDNRLIGESMTGSKAAKSSIRRISKNIRRSRKCSEPVFTHLLQEALQNTCYRRYLVPLSQLRKSSSVHIHSKIFFDVC